MPNRPPFRFATPTLRRRLPLGGLGLLAALGAQAEEPPVINVTATRTAQTADQSLAAVTVITREEIERSQARGLAELLRGLAGIDFSGGGGYGKVTSAFLRGANSGHVLVLVDGVRMGSATLGGVSWQYLDPRMIERIEIVRGPRSHLYGADAVGGVVQIFTRPTTQGVINEATLGGGSEGAGELAVARSENGAEGGYHLRLSHFETDGFDATHGNNPDRDGFRSTTFSGGLHRKLPGDGELRLNLLHALGNNDYDGWTAEDRFDNDFVQQALSGEYRQPLGERWESRLQLGRSLDRADDFRNGVRSSSFDTERRQASWQNDLVLGQGAVLTLGADWLDDRIDSSSSYRRTSRDNWGLFAEYQRGFDLGDLNLALRRDDNEAFGAHTTGGVGWGMAVGNGMRLTASYATAFKAPTMNDLYYVDPWGSSGSPNLRPEESQSFELGLSGRHHGIGWELRAFQSDIDELIQWVEVAPWQWQPQNVASARIEGIEGRIETALAEWRLSADLTLLDPRDETTDLRLPRRSRETLRLDANRELGPLSVGMTWLLQGARYDDPANQVRLPGFGTFDLRIHYPLADGWSLRGEARNLMGRDYSTAAGYREPGRSLFLSINYRTR